MSISFHFYLFDRKNGGYWPYSPEVTAALMCDFIEHIRPTHIVEHRFDGWYES